MNSVTTHGSRIQSRLLFWTHEAVQMRHESSRTMMKTSRTNLLVASHSDLLRVPCTQTHNTVRPEAEAEAEADQTVRCLETHQR